MGAFIVLEGGEGCGKSTQARLLYRRLLEEDYPSLLLYEPGGTSLGEQVRRLLMAQHGKVTISPMAELLLFSAARSELVQQVIYPALAEGQVVVCDRYTPSTIAYQGYGRGMPLETIDQVNRLSTGGMEPDLVVLLDMKPEEGLHRKSEEERQRFEEESLEFHRIVRRGYLEQAWAEPARWLRVDGMLPQQRIAEVIWERAKLLVREKGPAES